MKLNFSTDLKGILGVLGAAVGYILAYAPVAQQVLPASAQHAIGIVVAVASGAAMILSETGVSVPKITPAVEAAPKE